MKKLSCVLVLAGTTILVVLFVLAQPSCKGFLPEESGNGNDTLPNGNDTLPSYPRGDTLYFESFERDMGGWIRPHLESPQSSIGRTEATASHGRYSLYLQDTAHLVFQLRVYAYDVRAHSPYIKIPPGPVEVAFFFNPHEYERDTAVFTHSGAYIFLSVYSYPDYRYLACPLILYDGPFSPDGWRKIKQDTTFLDTVYVKMYIYASQWLRRERVRIHPPPRMRVLIDEVLIQKKRE